MGVVVNHNFFAKKFRMCSKEQRDQQEILSLEFKATETTEPPKTTTTETAEIVEISGLFQFNDLEISTPTTRIFPSIDYSYTPLVMEFGKYEIAKNSQKLVEYLYLKKEYKAALDLMLAGDRKTDVQTLSTSISCCLSLSLEVEALKYCEMFSKAHRKDTSVIFLIAKVYRLNNLHLKAIPLLIANLKCRHSDYKAWQELGLNFKCVAMSWAGACFAMISEFIEKYPYPSSNLVSTFKTKVLETAQAEMKESFRGVSKLDPVVLAGLVNPEDCEFLMNAFVQHHIIDSQNNLIRYT